MPRVMCCLSSLTPRDAVWIPVTVWIDAAEWEALLSWSRQAPRPTEYPTLAGLLAARLPSTLDLDGLVRLRDESSRVARDSLDGLAANGLAHLGEYIDRAMQHVQWWREDGCRTRLIPGFQAEYVVPESERDSLFAVVTWEEEGRLRKLFAQVRTAEDALQILGPPDDAIPAAVRPRQPEPAGAVPAAQRFRTLIYSRLSETAEVHFTERSNGYSVHLYRKYIGPPEQQTRRGKLTSGWRPLQGRREEGHS
jgi:hypothetical protein